jgi:hypothetical protein
MRIAFIYNKGFRFQSPGSKVQRSKVSEVLAAGFSLLAAGQKQVTAYQLPGARDRQPDVITFEPLNPEPLNISDC